MKWQSKQRPRLQAWLQGAGDVVALAKRPGGPLAAGFDHYETEDYFKCFLLQGASFAGLDN